MSVLLLGLLVSLASAHGSSGITCPGNETCWQYELGEIVETVSEDRVLASLLCHLDCLDTGEKVEHCSVWLYIVSPSTASIDKASFVSSALSRHFFKGKPAEIAAIANLIAS